MEIQNILMLIQAFTEHSLTELSVEDGGVKVCLKREIGAPGAVVVGRTAANPAERGSGAGVLGSVNPAAGGPVPGAAGVMAVSGTAGLGGADTAAGVQAMIGVQPAAGAPMAAGVQPAVGVQMAAGIQPVAGVPLTSGIQPAAGIQPAGEAAQPSIDSGNVVVSPLVGIFYSASSPDAEAFVKVGDRVKKGQVLGIIEAMKLMNEIESEYDGVVEAILVKNEDMVEYGQPLFRIR